MEDKLTQMGVTLCIGENSAEEKCYKCNLPIGATLLDALLCVQETLDSSVAFRWNCRTGQCGLCAVRVGNQRVLACMMKLRPGMRYKVSPLRKGRILSSLVEDISAIYIEYFKASQEIGEDELSRKVAFEQLMLER